MAGPRNSIPTNIQEKTKKKCFLKSLVYFTHFTIVIMLVKSTVKFLYLTLATIFLLVRFVMIAVSPRAFALFSG